MSALAAPLTIRALVVDDEALARAGLCQLVHQLTGWSVVGQAESGPAALRAVVERLPDVVFLDIRMPGLDGLRVAEVLAELDPRPLVVFATAYEEHALEAFAVEAADYLVKPFDDRRFHATAARLERRLRLRRAQRDLSPPGRRRDRPEPSKRPVAAGLGSASEAAPLTSLAVRSVGRVRLVSVDEIQWIAAAGNYVRLYLGDACRLHRATLRSLELRLDPQAFVRIHRSTIVRKGAVAELRTPAVGRALVVLRDGTELDVSQRFKQRAFAALLADRN